MIHDWNLIFEECLAFSDENVEKVSNIKADWGRCRPFVIKDAKCLGK